MFTKEVNLREAMGKKRITLPKDFKDMLEDGDLEKLKSVFEKCEIDARGGYSKHTAIAFDLCPDELTEWLIQNGADINATDEYGDTPLHKRSLSRRSSIKILLELGADFSINTKRSGTPLHVAAHYHNVQNAELLIKYGAKVNEKDTSGFTPLEVALQSCKNINIENMVMLADLLLHSGAKETQNMKKMVSKIGEQFEFHRESFNKDSVDSVSKALDKLYGIFNVTPIPRRIIHDINSEIKIKEKTWEKQHQELWKLLVPFKNNGIVQIEFDVVFIGTWAKFKNDWLWAWANNSMLDSVKEKSKQIKKLSIITGNEVFNATNMEADETTAWEIASMALHVLNAQGMYRSPGEKSDLFLAIMGKK